MTPDEMRKKADGTVADPFDNEEAWFIAAELCARLDALVAVEERIAKALERRPFPSEEVEALTHTYDGDDREVL